MLAASSKLELERRLGKHGVIEKTKRLDAARVFWD